MQEVELEQLQSGPRKFTTKDIIKALAIMITASFAVYLLLSIQPQVILEQRCIARQVTAVFLTCCRRHHMLTPTLQSFFQMNESPVSAVIVVNDGPLDPQLAEIMTQFQNITFLITGEKIGQLRSIDLALRFVKTPYVYYSEDDRKMIKAGVIKGSIDLLQKQPKLLQVWYEHHGNIVFAESNKVSTNWVWGGFSFYPAVWRMSDYYLLEGGFSGVTRDRSKGTGAGNAEMTIINMYKQMGYYVRQAEEDHYEDIGVNAGLPRHD